MRRRMWSVASLLLTLAACSNGTTPVVSPAPAKPALPISTGIDQQLTVDVGTNDANAAKLAVWVFEPEKGTPVKGTVLFLHGFMGTHRQVQNAAVALRKAGFRAVVPDLRGFGASTGAQFTFGVQDAIDLTQLTDELQKRKLCGDTLGVYGTSYGAAAAIMYAAADPRVKTVISVAPFASIRDEVPSFGRHLLRGAGALLSDSNLNAIADVAADIVKMDLDTARPLDAIKKVKGSVLLIHGDADTIVPHTASEQLHAANPATELLTIPDKGHLDLCFDIPGQLQATTRAWFEKHLAE